jgi:two-component system osmolarity sensor histidine kinase EnvZ
VTFPGWRLGAPPLFWRTFLLVVVLAGASLAAWIPSVRILEREPRAHQFAGQVIAIVETTRIALVHSDPGRRRELLENLLARTQVRVLPLEASDRFTPVHDNPFMALVQSQVVEQLGPGTRMAATVNGVPGFWVSFAIDDDAYWVFIDRDLLHRGPVRGWIAWAVMATLFSLLAAVALTRLVNGPLARLARAAEQIGAGRRPEVLPERGPAEIRSVNRNFNRMVSDLDKLDRDRAVLLAGVSHDLRTPLTRLRLELELSGLPAASREGMLGDLEQMDRIIDQFHDYAVPVPQRAPERIDLSALVASALQRHRLMPQSPPAGATGTPPGGVDPAPGCQATLAPGLEVEGHRVDLERALDNLLGNALRYGRRPDGTLEMEVRLQVQGERLVLEIADHGPGIAAAETDRLLRPFERGESARSGATGAGLGLAIVERIVRLHQGRLDLLPTVGGGLTVRLELPAPGRPAGVAQTV